MPCFSTNKRSYTSSDRSHFRLIRLHSTTDCEASRLPSLWIGNRAWIRLKSIVAAAIIQIIKLAWVSYLGALSSINAILIPWISAHHPILAQCKVHRPWALFCEDTVLINSKSQSRWYNPQCWNCILKYSAWYQIENHSEFQALIALRCIEMQLYVLIENWLGKWTTLMAAPYFDVIVYGNVRYPVNMQ